METFFGRHAAFAPDFVTPTVAEVVDVLALLGANEMSGEADVFRIRGLL